MGKEMGFSTQCLLVWGRNLDLKKYSSFKCPRYPKSKSFKKARGFASGFRPNYKQITK